MLADWDGLLRRQAEEVGHEETAAERAEQLAFDRMIGRRAAFEFDVYAEMNDLVAGRAGDDDPRRSAAPDSWDVAHAISNVAYRFGLTVPESVTLALDADPVRVGSDYRPAHDDGRETFAEAAKRAVREFVGNSWQER